MHPEDPVRLGTYRVVRRLGDVPIGATLLGTDQTGRAVVLTVVDPRIAARDGFRERFTREARAAASAPPSFVAPVLDVDAAAEPPWLATVAVPGPTLEGFVGERGPLGEAGTEVLIRRLGDGLAGMHAAGLVHGDLTPSAVVLAEEGPRLVGFGLARAAGPGHGTAGFEAPEQAAGPDVWTHAAADVFALGCVLGYAATGRSPFAAEGAEATRRRAATAAPDLGATPEPLRSVALACLRRDPAQRPSAAQVAAMLAPAATTAPSTGSAAGPGWPTRTLVGGPPVGAPAAGASPVGPPSAPARRRGPLVAVATLATAVVLALVAGAALLVARTDATASARPTAAAGPTAGPTSGAAATAVAATVTASGPDAGTDATLADAAAFGADSPRFATPSRNIACQMNDTSAAGDGDARCDVAQRTWTLPVPPAGCAGAFGGGALVSGAQRGALTCAGDTVADPGLQVLPYGRALSFGGIVCDSQETGVRCVNRGTGHGFRVARSSYDLF